jgi:subtilisin family serine protease
MGFVARSFAPALSLLAGPACIVALVAGCELGPATPDDPPRAPRAALLDREPPASSGSVAADVGERRLIVRFRDRLREPADVIQSRGLRFADHCPSGGGELDRLGARYHVRSVAPVFASWFGAATDAPGRGALAERRKAFHASVARSRAAFPARARRAPAGAEPPDLTSVYFIEVPAGTDVRAMALAYASNENVEYAAPDPLASVDALPNDPYLFTGYSWRQDYPDLWAIHRIGAPAAWDAATGATVVVAVVDTGLDHAHADIAANVWTNEAEASGAAGVDDDGNGWVDDVRGWDFAYGNADVMDRSGHGTAVAGVVAASGDNATGVVGVAYGARIMPVKALNDGGSGTMGNIASAIAYAARNGADVVNGSVGCFGCTGTPVVADAVALARSLGCVVTLAAGNDAADVKYEFPANLQDALTVAATGEDDGPSSFSNFGHLVDVAAPGGGPGTDPSNILTLRASGTGTSTYVVGTSYLRTSGTSFAAPHVAGVAALLLSANPALTVADVESIIRHTAADRVGAAQVDGPGFDPGYGWGRLDAAAAVARAFDPPADPPILEVVAGPLEFVLPQSSCPGTSWALPLDVYNLGGGALSWSASGPSWLGVTPPSGTTASLSVRASVDQLSNRSGTLTISPLDASAGAPVDLAVVEQVVAGARIVTCDAAVARGTGWQYWWPTMSSSGRTPPGIPDGAGGALFSWNSPRIQRLDGLGRPLWPSDGVPVTSTPNAGSGSALAADGAGGAIAVWRERVTGASTTDLRAQRVDASGLTRWGSEGVWVCQAAGEQLEQQVVPDGAGGAIVVWTDQRDGTTRSMIRAQRLDASGTVSWASAGVTVSTTVATPQTAPRVVPDGGGGAIVAWSENGVRVQRFDASGNAAWAAGGISLGRGTAPAIVTDGAGGAIVAWFDGTLRAARVDASGHTRWPQDGVPVLAGATASRFAWDPDVQLSGVIMAPDGEGGALLVWHDQRNGRDWDIYGQRLDPGGNRLWGDDGAPVTAAQGDQVSPELVPDGRGGAIYAWTDYRAGNGDVFVQRLGATGRPLLGANGLWLEPKSAPGELPWKSAGFDFGGQYFPSLVSLADHRVLVTWDDWISGATFDIDVAGKVLELAADPTIAPDGTTVAPGGKVSFTASGGTGEGWTWSLATNASGGAIDPRTGEYTAGPGGAATDVVQVEDSFENVATASVSVVAPLSVDPGAATVAPRDQLRFTASGGSGSGYRWSLVTSATGGTIEGGTGAYGPETGLYRAGPIGGATDVVQVEDLVGNVATAIVTSTPAISLTASASTLPPGASAWLEAQGGSGAGYEWSLLAGASGGSVVAVGPGLGLYRAGPGGGVTDVVQVVDSVGGAATAAIDVTAGISIAPSAPTVAARSTVQLGATGGSGSGYVWLVSVDASGGTIDPSSGTYTAGPKGDTVDEVWVVDSLGNTASVAVTVTPAVAESRPLPEADGCGCRHGGSGYGSLALAAALLLAAPRRPGRRRDA